MRLSQRQTYTRKVDSSIKVSNLLFMEEIAKLIKCKVTSRERQKATTVEKTYEVRSDTIESKILIFDYLNKFPLYGYKYPFGVNLYKIHNLPRRGKEYKTLEGKKKLEEYSHNMKDTKDKAFTQLDNFYNN